MTLFPTARERGAGTTHRLYPRPPRPTSRRRLFAWSVFWLQLQLSRRRSLSEEDSEGRAVREITARSSSGGSGSRRRKEEEGFFRFTSQEEQRGRVLKKKKRPGSAEKVSDTESRGKGAEELPLSCQKMELPAAGEHVFAVESIEKKRSRKVGHKSTEGDVYTQARG